MDGEKIILTENDNMIPGRGYSVNVNRDCILSYRNDRGLTREEALTLNKFRGTRIHYEEGSTGDIRDSKIESLGEDIDQSGIMIESSSVSIDNSEFKDNFIDININSASPTIRNSNFENFTYTSIFSQDSYPDVYNNRFTHSSQYAMVIYGGSPLLSENKINYNMGIYLNGSNTKIFSNRFEYTLENAVTMKGGTPLVDDNEFVYSGLAAIKTESTNVSIIGNTFFKNQGSINIIDGSPNVRDNLFKNEGYGILVQKGSIDIINNDFREINSWSIDIEESRDLSVIDNTIRNSALGMRVTGTGPLIKGNTIENVDNVGVLIRQSTDFIFEDNLISGITGTAVSIESSEGMTFMNKISRNRLAVELKSPVLFIGNTVSNNAQGINIQRSSPYLEDNIFSNNENYAIRFEGSSSFIRRNSILSSDYHLYLINSEIIIVDSAFKMDNVYIDSNSDLTVKNTLNASMDEGTTYVDHSIHESLPPQAEITDVYGYENVDVEIRTNSVYFFPEDYFWGTVNMTFNVTIFGEWETEIPFNLEINPVNNPPRLLDKTVKITYEPTRVRWEVIYEDKDGDLPTYIELVVDGDHYQMKEYNESDQCTFDGKKYYYEMYLESGTYEYYMEAEENNPLGANNTIRTRFYDLDISPPKPGWLGMSDMEAVGVGTFLLLGMMILIYLRVREKGKQKESSISKDKISSKDMIKALPVMRKKSDVDKENSTKKSPSDKVDKEKDIGTKTLPVMKKREGKKSKKEDIRKHRVIKEEDQSDEADNDIEPVIDMVSDEPVEDDEKDKRKKQRVIRNKKTVHPKKRVMKEDNSDKSKNGKMKRVLKED